MTNDPVAELQQGHAHVVDRRCDHPVSLEAKHAVDRSEQIAERVDVVNTDLNQRTARALFATPPPRIRRHRPARVGADVGLDADDLAELSGVDEGPELSCARLSPALVADRQDDPGLSADAGRRLTVARGQGNGFFDEHVLPVARGLFNLMPVHVVGGSSGNACHQPITQLNVCD